MHGGEVQVPTSVSFELDSCAMTADGRLEVTGRWFGVRGRRFVRPSLTLAGENRALAVLEHKPWAATDGETWTAAFPLSSELTDIADAELAVAPDIAVVLTGLEGVEGVGRPKRTGKSRSSKSVARPRASAIDVEITLLRDERDALRRALEFERGEALRLRAALDQARDAKVEEQAALGRRDAALARLDEVTRERDEAFAARDRALERARENLEAAVEARVAELRAEVERQRVGAGRIAEAMRERDEARAERDKALAARNSALAARDKALAARKAALRDRDAARRDLKEAASKRAASLGDGGLARALAPPSRSRSPREVWLGRAKGLVPLLAILLVVFLLVHSS